MTDIASLIADMVKEGVSPDMIGRVAAALSERPAVLVPDEAAERRRSADRDRKRLRKSAEVRGSAETPPPFVPPDKEGPEPQEITPPISPRPAERARVANPSVVLQSVVDAMTAQSFVGHCSEKRKPLSSQQAEAIVSVLREVRAAGGNPADALRFAVKRGWTSLEVEFLRNNGFPFKSGPPAEAEDWPARIASWRADPGNWIHAWGPKPDERGTRVPPELLQRTAA